jgi:hypothetical protein
MTLKPYNLVSLKREDEKLSGQMPKLMEWNLLKKYQCHWIQTELNCFVQHGPHHLYWIDWSYLLLEILALGFL